MFNCTHDADEDEAGGVCGGGFLSVGRVCQEHDGHREAQSRDGGHAQRTTPASAHPVRHRDGFWQQCATGRPATSTHARHSTANATASGNSAPQTGLPSKRGNSTALPRPSHCPLLLGPPGQIYSGFQFYF